MKRILTLIIVIALFVVTYAQQSNSLQQQFLSRASKEATVAFEGKMIKKNKSFWGINENKNDIYTSYTIEVKEVHYGSIVPGTIEIVVLGGQLVKDGMDYSSYSEHGNGMCFGDALFFAKPFTKGNTGIINSNTGDFDLVGSICFNADGTLENTLYDSTYTTKEQLYNGMLQFFNLITIPSANKKVEQSTTGEKK